jgi:hypothetical protein
VLSHRSAASASAADTERPSSAAWTSNASNISAGNDTDRFTTELTPSWYDHGTTGATRCADHRSTERTAPSVTRPCF